ncbi:MAG: hypothetical protein AAF646_16820 [Pseudomonadota bacterium]
MKLWGTWRSIVKSLLLASGGGVALALILCLGVGQSHAFFWREAPPRVLFVGKMFQVNQGVLGEAAAFTGRSFRVNPLPVSVDLYGAARPDLRYLRQVLRQDRPDVVVLSAFEAPEARLGKDRALAANLAHLAEVLRAQGADVLILAHPPAKRAPQIGYASAARRIERIVARVADDTGATLVRTGAFFAAQAQKDREGLYRTRGYAFSDLGERAVGLTIAQALGVDLTEPGRTGDALPSRWIALVAEVARSGETEH